MLIASEKLHFILLKNILIKKYLSLHQVMEIIFVIIYHGIIFKKCIFRLFWDVPTHFQKSAYDIPGQDSPGK